MINFFTEHRRYEEMSYEYNDTNTSNKLMFAKLT